MILQFFTEIENGNKDKLKLGSLCEKKVFILER